MNIHRIELKNIQGFEKASIELSPFLNVIYGDSDKGKSSIIRALKWFFTNKIRSDVIRRHDTKKSSVLVENENFIAERVLSDSINKYVMDDEIYRAFKTSVPEDITQSFQIESVHIQSQKDTYFLLDKSPGEISRSLNTVSGLDLTDKVIKEVNSQIRTINSSISEKKEKRKELRRKISLLKWVNVAEIELRVIKNLHHSLQVIQNKISTVINLLNIYSKVENEYNKFLPKDMTKEIYSLYDFYSSIEEKNILLDKINKIIDQYDILSNKLKNKNHISKDELRDLFEYQNELNSLKKKLDKVSSIIDEYEALENLHEQKVEKTKEAKNNLVKGLKKLGECPLCGSKK